MHFFQGRENHILLVKGAPERILPRCMNIMRKGETKAMRKKDLDKVHKACEDMGASGERVLGFAVASLPFAEFPRDFKFVETANKENISFNFPMVRIAK